jgi:hypothetical protein
LREAKQKIAAALKLDATAWSDETLILAARKTAQGR